MKIALAAVILAVMALFAFAWAQTIVSPEKNLSGLCLNTNLPLSQSGEFLLTNQVPGVMEPLSIIHPSQDVKTLGPGIYKSEPYTAVIIVPPPTGDHCIIGNLGPSSMPMANPGITLVPESTSGN
jgi:hypothetical protein